MGLILSDDLIAARMFRLDGERVEIADTMAPGLRIRLSETSARWSILTHLLPGRRSRITLGSWPRISVEQARAAATRIHLDLPASAAPSTTPQPLIAQTMDCLLALYERDRIPHLKRGPQTLRSLKRLVSPIGARDAATITRRDISELVRAMRFDAPVHANRCLAYTKAFFSWSVAEGYLESNPAVSVGKPTRETPRERTPSIAELADIWRGADRLGFPFGHITQLLLLTAARLNEVGGMRLDELDLPAGQPGGVWIIPASRSKNGRALRVPLSPLARSIVEDAVREKRCRIELEWRKATGGPYLFARTSDRPVSGWSATKRRLDAEISTERANSAPLAHWRFHDLRRSFATIACDTLHVAPEVVDRCLNHVGSATSSTVARVYARNELFDQRLDALYRWAELIEQALAPQ